MSQQEELENIRAFIEAANLGQTARQFPQDVLVAAAVAARLRSTFPRPQDNKQDVWPPMQVKGAPCIG